MTLIAEYQSHKVTYNSYYVLQYVKCAVLSYHFSLLFLFTINIYNPKLYSHIFQVNNFHVPILSLFRFSCAS